MDRDTNFLLGFFIQVNALYDFGKLPCQYLWRILCCHPRLPEEGQVALILNILCGFSVGEIANALVSSHAAIEKRIARSKKILAKSKRLFDVSTPREVAARLPAVHTALYLLFNEGYHGASPVSAVRTELCREAMPLRRFFSRIP